MPKDPTIHITVNEISYLLTNEEMSRMWEETQGWDSLTRWGYDPSHLVDLGLVEIEHREYGDSPARLTDAGKAVVEARKKQVKDLQERLRVEHGVSTTTSSRVYTAGFVAVSVEQLERLVGASTV